MTLLHTIRSSQRQTDTEAGLRGAYKRATLSGEVVSDGSRGLVGVIQV